MRASYSDQTISSENVYELKISANRHDRDSLLYTLTTPNIYTGYKDMLIKEFSKVEAIHIQGAKNSRLSGKDKQLITRMIEMSPHVRELGFHNIGVPGLEWIPDKEKFTNFEFENSCRNSTVNFKGIEGFPNLQRLFFGGFFDTARHFECIAKCRKPVSIFSAHSRFGKNTECFRHFLMKEWVVTELIMQEMSHITELDHPEVLEILEFYGTGEIGLDLSRLVNLKYLVFESFGNGVRKPIQAASLMGLDHLKELWLSREAIDDIAKTETCSFWREIKR